MKKYALLAALVAALSNVAYADQAGSVNEGVFKDAPHAQKAATCSGKPTYLWGSSDDCSAVKSGDFSEARLADGTQVIRGGQ